MVLGARGAGKDVTSHEIVRCMHRETGKPIYIDLEPEKYDLPGYFKQDTGKFVNKSIYLLSDAHLKVYARNWHTDINQTIDMLITLSRQKDLDMVLSTQETARIDRNVVMGVDALVFKEPSIMSEEFERPEVRKLVELARPTFEGKTRQQKWETAFVKSGTGFHVVTDIKKPFYWSEELSKRYGGLDMNPEPEEPKAAVLRIRRS